MHIHTHSGCCRLSQTDCSWCWLHIVGRHNYFETQLISKYSHGVWQCKVISHELCWSLLQVLSIAVSTVATRDARGRQDISMEYFSLGLSPVVIVYNHRDIYNLTAYWIEVDLCVCYNVVLILFWPYACQYDVGTKVDLLYNYCFTCRVMICGL